MQVTSHAGHAQRSWWRVQSAGSSSPCAFAPSASGQSLASHVPHVIFYQTFYPDASDCGDSVAWFGKLAFLVCHVNLADLY